MGTLRRRCLSLHYRALFVVGLLGTMVAPWSARAIPPPLTDEQLSSSADLIATGTVRSIKERDEVSHPGVGAERGTLVIAHLTVAVEVQGVEKGSVPGASRTIRLITEQIKSKPEGWVGGPLSPPDLRVGNRVKVFLVQDKAVWAPINGQGIQVLP